MLKWRGLVHLDQSGVGRLDVDEGAVPPLLEASGDVNLARLTLGRPQPPARARPVSRHLVYAVVEQLAGHPGVQLSSGQLLVNLQPAHESKGDWVEVLRVIDITARLQCHRPPERGPFNRLSG